MGAGRECRYSGARRVIGGVGAIRGYRGVRHVLGAGRECRYSRTRMGRGSIKGHLEVPRGCWDH